MWLIQWQLSFYLLKFLLIRLSKNARIDLLPMRYRRWVFNSSPSYLNVKTFFVRVTVNHRSRCRVCNTLTCIRHASSWFLQLDTLILIESHEFVLPICHGLFLFLKLCLEVFNLRSGFIPNTLLAFVIFLPLRLAS